MARLEIDLPDNYIFETEIEIRITDLNYANHLRNDAVAGYLQVARTKYLDSLGLNELNIGNHVGLIQGDLAIVYLSEGFFANIVRVRLAIAELSNSSFSVLYLLENLTTNKELAKASTRMICFSYETRKAQAIPLSFRSLFNAQ